MLRWALLKKMPPKLGSGEGGRLLIFIILMRINQVFWPDSAGVGGRSIENSKIL